MKFTATNLINTALAEDGYCGKKTNDQLDDFTANTSGKYNKYAAEIDSFFDSTTKTPLNGLKNGYDWCCLYILDMAYKVTGDIDAAFDYLCQKNNNCAAGAPWMARFFGYANRYDQNPQVGDVGFVTIDGDLNGHVCIIIDVNGDTITSIDGNWGSKVQKVTRQKAAFSGFGHPKYEEEEEEEKEEDSTETTDEKTQKLIDELRANISSLQATLEEYKTKLNTMTAQYDEAQTKLAEKTAKIDDFLAALASLAD